MRNLLVFALSAVVLGTSNVALAQPPHYDDIPLAMQMHPERYGYSVPVGNKKFLNAQHRDQYRGHDNRQRYMPDHRFKHDKHRHQKRPQHHGNRFDRHHGKRYPSYRSPHYRHGYESHYRHGGRHHRDVSIGVVLGPHGAIRYWQSW